MKAYQLIFLSGRTITGQLLITKLYKTKKGPIALDTKLGWILSAPVNNPFASVNNSVLLSHVMEVQSEFMDACFKTRFE